jgi:hypothetical protein
MKLINEVIEIIKSTEIPKHVESKKTLEKHGWRDQGLGRYTHKDYPGHTMQVYSGYVSWKKPYDMKLSPKKQLPVENIKHSTFAERYKAIHPTLR